MAKFTKLRDRIVTELSVEEAMMLALVLNCVGGDPKNSPRGYCEAVLRALADCGVAPRYGGLDSEQVYVSASLAGGGLYFRDGDIHTLWDNYQNGVRHPEIKDK